MSRELKQDLSMSADNLFHSVGTFYDCTFVTGTEGNTKQFLALKAHLANISDVFKAQFYGNFREASQNRDDPIVLPNCNPDVFECILRVSCGLVPDINQNNVLDLIIESKYYNITMLVNECFRWINRHISAENVLSILNQAYLRDIIDIEHGIVTNINNENGNVSMISDSMSVESFVARCLLTIFDYGDKIVTQEYFWQSLHINVLMLFIGKDYFVVNEEKLWSALIKWAKYQASCVDNNINENKDDKQDSDSDEDDIDIQHGKQQQVDGGNEEKDIEAVDPPPKKRIRLSSAVNNNVKSNDIDNKDNNMNDGGPSAAEEATDLSLSMSVRKPTSMEIADKFAKSIRTMEGLAQSKSKKQNKNNKLNDAAFHLIQPLLKYVRFTRMSKKYFGINVRDWLNRNDLEFLFLRVCCDNTFRDSKKDWINYNARKSLSTIAKSGHLYRICCHTPGSTEMLRFPEADYSHSNCIWPNAVVNGNPDWWFVADLNILMKDVKHLGEEWEIVWKPGPRRVNNDKFNDCDSDSDNNDMIPMMYVSSVIDHDDSDSDDNNDNNSVDSTASSDSNGGYRRMQQLLRLHEVEVYTCVKQGMTHQDMNQKATNDASNWKVITTTTIKRRTTFSINVASMKSPFLKFRISKSYFRHPARVADVAIKPKCIKFQVNLL